ncbi:MAG: ribbon-helix-helix protein, CopG family [Candidatus Bathyarchaeia archaeon]|jgi:metal-responsive CopG/Arc/MetJ family transcriptional regulator
MTEIKEIAEYRMGRRSKRMANITATLPVQLLDKVDELIDEDRAPSRSYIIREAVRKYLKEFERT